MDALQEQFLIDQAEADMSPMQAYWIRVNGVASELDPEAATMDEKATRVNSRHNGRFLKTSNKVIWVTSVKVPGKSIIPGRVFSMSPYLAAERIVTGTHRVSSPAEIQAWEDEQNRRRKVAADLKVAQQPPVAPTQVTVELSADAVREIRGDQSHGKQRPSA